MARTSLLTLSIAALLVIPAPAFAGDSLLSGYGGPGGGEQVVLGAKLLPGGGGGKGGGAAGLRTTGATPPAVSPAAPLPSGGPASGLTRLAPAPAPAAGSATAHRSSPAASTTAPAAATPAAPLTAQPASTRTVASGDAGSPLGGGALLIVILGALGLGLTAAGTRRLVSRSGSSGPGAAARA